MRKWIFLGAVVLVSATLLILRRPHELSFLDDYPLLDAREAGLRPTPYRPIGWLVDRNGGTRIFTLKGDYAKVERRCLDELRKAGFTAKKINTEIVTKNGGGYVFIKGQDQLMLLNGRSVIKTDPRQGWRGRVIVFKSEAKKNGMDPSDVEGWITIDHQWTANTGFVSQLLGRPRTVSAAPAPAP